MIRTFTLLPAFLFGILSLHAQDLRYYGFETPVQPTELKFMIQHVRDLDPDATVLPSDDGTVVMVRASAQVSDAQLRSAMQEAGVSLRPGTPEMNSLLGQEQPDGVRPVYVATGNDAEDRARYAAAVHRWNQEHPQETIVLPHFQD